MFSLSSCHNISGNYVNKRIEDGKTIIHTIKLNLDNTCDYYINTYENDALIKTYRSNVCSWNRYIIASENNREQINFTIDNPNYDPNATNGNKHKTKIVYYDYFKGKIVSHETGYEFIQQ